MHGMKKRFLAILMTLAMAIGFTTSVFAAEPADVLSTEPTAVATEAAVVSEEASTRSLGKLLTFGSTTITGGSGVLYVTLPSGNYWADLVAQISYTSQSGAVVCSVTTPDGNYIGLGTISGSGSSTYAHEVFYAPAGTYAFYFSSANTEPMEVAAYIYD